MKNLLLIIISFLFGLSSVAQKKIVNTVPVNQEISSESKVLKRKVAIARFSNETQYAKGIFYDKNNDPMGKQAVDILSTKLASSNKFILLERQDLGLMFFQELKHKQLKQGLALDWLMFPQVK